METSVILWRKEVIEEFDKKSGAHYVHSRAKLASKLHSLKMNP
ncbi:MAG: hypothetical protein QXV59_03470 [Nitrososphaerota archaeon]